MQLVLPNCWHNKIISNWFFKWLLHKGQVELLLQLEIPAVIASSVPINDTTAKDFAANFYLALANDHNLKEAFEIAAGGVKFREGSDLQIHRGLKPRAAQTENVLPWGLYLNETTLMFYHGNFPRSSNKEIVIESTVASIADRNKFVVNNLTHTRTFPGTRSHTMTFWNLLYV